MSKILIVDDHAVVRLGLRQILEEELGKGVYGEAEDTDEALKELDKRAWDAVILDITLPGKSGMEVLRQSKKNWPDLPILVLSMHPEDQYAIRVLRAGASGYMTKESAPEELGKALRKVLGGGRYVSPELAETLAMRVGTNMEDPPHASLSNREFQVMCMIGEGKTASEIADKLGLSVKTISTFRSRILKKMRMRNNAQLMSYALRSGLVT